MTSQRLFLAILLSATVASAAFCQQPHNPILVDGQNETIAGTLAVRHLGYALFVTIKTREPVVPKWSQTDLDAIREGEKFGSTDHSTVRELWVILSGQEDTLLKHIGQRVTVSGKVQLNATSPYYFNGTLIKADTVVFRDGTVLLPQVGPYVKKLPAGIDVYDAAMTLTASGRWSYRAWNRSGHELIPADGLLSCRLNGSGDVVNCYCLESFQPVGSGQMKMGHFALEEKTDWDFAQFLVPVPEGRIVTFSKAVECHKVPTTETPRQ